jgi:hypothetical protein
MAKFKPLPSNGDIKKTFASEDGKHYRGMRQDIDPIIQHVRDQNEWINGAAKAGNRNNWRYQGTIPMTVLVDWLQQHGYTIDEFARADRNDVYGPKYKFLKYFKTREFSKLHTDHVTTKRESNQIVVPNYVGSK